MIESMTDILFFLWVILPILVTVGAIALIFAVANVLKARAAAISKTSFEELANELRAENAIILADIAEMKESLNAVNKMLKAVE